jgi:hypothetical protein
MSVPPLASIAVGVLAERRPAVTRWADHVWVVTDVLLDPPELAPWTVLHDQDGTTRFFAGSAELELFRTETDNLKHNTEAPDPRIWVVLRPVEAEPGMRLQRVTVDPGEAHLFADVGNDQLESLPLPAPLLEAIRAFVARHHEERQFFKRKRDRADPEALGRRVADFDDE